MKQMIYTTTREISLLEYNNYKGFNYYILSLGVHPTAYIQIPKDHKLFRVIYDELPDIDVHGGFTYSRDYLWVNKKTKLDGWFIGWDYAHYKDYMGYYENTEREWYRDTINLKRWTTKEMIQEAKSVIEQILEV